MFNCIFFRPPATPRPLILCITAKTQRRQLHNIFSPFSFLQLLRLSFACNLVFFSAVFSFFHLEVASSAAKDAKCVRLCARCERNMVRLYVKSLSSMMTWWLEHKGAWKKTHTKRIHLLALCEGICMQIEKKNTRKNTRQQTANCAWGAEAQGATTIVHETIMRSKQSPNKTNVIVQNRSGDAPSVAPFRSKQKCWCVFGTRAWMQNVSQWNENEETTSTLCIRLQMRSTQWGGHRAPVNNFSSIARAHWKCSQPSEMRANVDTRQSGWSKGDAEPFFSVRSVHLQFHNIPGMHEMESHVPEWRREWKRFKIKCLRRRIIREKW